MANIETYASDSKSAAGYNEDYSQVGGWGYVDWKAKTNDLVNKKNYLITRLEFEVSYNAKNDYQDTTRFIKYDITFTNNKTGEITHVVDTETVGKDEGAEVIFGRYLYLYPDLDGSLPSFSYDVKINLNDTTAHFVEDIHITGDVIIPSPHPSYAATIVTAPDFNDEENVTITYNVPTIPDIVARDYIRRDKATAYLVLQDGSIIGRDINLNETSVTFTFTAEERAQLIAAVARGSNAPIKWRIETEGLVIISGSDYAPRVDKITDADIGKYFRESVGVSEVAKTFTILEALPSLNPTVEDVNSMTLALTGDKNTFVRYYSYANYSIGANPSKGATLTYQQIACGSKISTTPTGTLYGIEKGTFLFTVADSRELINSAVLEKKFIDYVKLTSNVVKNGASSDGSISFTISGNYFNGTFGAVANTLTVKYRYKSSSGSYGAWITTTATLKENTYEADVTVTGLDYTETYTIQAQSTDKLSNITSAECVIKILPIFDWSDGDFNFNVPVSYTDEDGNSYSITNAVKNLESADLDSLPSLAGVINAMTNRYELTVEATPRANWSSAECSMYLYGNTIRGYIKVVRNASSGSGNIANENVCGVQFDSGGKVTGFGAVSFPSGGAGGLAHFNITDTVIFADDGSVDESQVGQGAFTVELTATGTAGTEWTGYFVMPCLIDLSKY